MEERLRVQFGFGWASGDPNSSTLLPSGTFPDPRLTRTLSQFAFHPDYRVDLILFRNILQQVTGAYYFRPSAEYDFLRSKDGQKLGGGVAAIWSRASDFIQTPGHASDLGVELNGKLDFQSRDGSLNDDPNKMGGFYTSLEYGVLFPLSGLGYLQFQQSNFAHTPGQSLGTADGSNPPLVSRRSFLTLRERCSGFLGISPAKRRHDLIAPPAFGIMLARRCRCAPHGTMAVGVFVTTARDAPWVSEPNDGVDLFTRTPLLRQASRRGVVFGLLGLLCFRSTGRPKGHLGEDESTAFRNLGASTDYRVRVLRPCPSVSPIILDARPALEKALGDAHPAVRVAAAAALASLGDVRAVKALRAALAGETEVNARQQFEQSLKRLGQAMGGSTAKAKYLIAIGKLENRSTETAPAVVSAFQGLTRTRMGQVPGVELVAAGTPVGTEGKSRGLPAFQIDGVLAQLNRKHDGSDVGFAARVEYMIRKMPDQTLKGTVAGNAQALADAHAVKSSREVSQLQIDSMTAAIDIALNGVPSALDSAGR